LAAMDSNMQKQRYAWLEQDEGMWHFLTNLFADPGESTRRWADSRRALEELRIEGWTVISPYPDPPPDSQQPRNRACGYGLAWTSYQTVWEAESSRFLPRQTAGGHCRMPGVDYAKMN
jgi:hypothetical protein